MFSKMMVTDVDMFCVRPELGKPCLFQCTRVVLKNFAVNDWFIADDFKIPSLHLLKKKHDWDDVMKAIDIAIYTASVVDNATCVCNLEAQIIGQLA